MSGNGYETWGPCTPAEAEALAAGMAAAERGGHYEGGYSDGTPREWVPDPEPWECMPDWLDDAPEATAVDHG
jgi:hypothetical protein